MVVRMTDWAASQAGSRRLHPSSEAAPYEAGPPHGQSL